MSRPNADVDPTDKWIDRMVDAPGEKYPREIKPDLEKMDWFIEPRRINDKPYVVMRTRVPVAAHGHFEPRYVAEEYLAAVKLDDAGEAELLVIHPGLRVTTDIVPILKQLDREVTEVIRRGENA